MTKVAGGLLVMSVVLLCGCGDVGGQRFRWGWDRGISKFSKKRSNINPNYDEHGNYIPPKSVSRTYRIPDIHSGVGYDVKANKMRVFLEMELLEAKITKSHTLMCGMIGGEEFVGIHLSKKLTSIFEIGAGAFVGFDFDEKECTYGVDLLLIKF